MNFILLTNKLFEEKNRRIIAEQKIQEQDKQIEEYKTLIKKMTDDYQKISDKVVLYGDFIDALRIENKKLKNQQPKSS